MKRGRSIIRLIVSEVTAFFVLAIPLALWFFEDYPPESAMMIYALESAAAIILAILCVLLISPSYDPGGSPRYKRRRKLIADFSIIAFGFLAAAIIFLSLFLILVLRASFDMGQIAFGFGLVSVFLIAEFISNTVTLRPLPLKKAENLLSRSMGKAALLFLAVFIGLFLAGMVNEWFVIPFVILKAMVDIGEPIQTYFGKNDPTAPLITFEDLSKL
ncbi:MAG: hypothetical protein AB7Q37_08830 [Pyrinomonadaceae bacterium]